MIGAPLAPTGRPSRENVDALTARCWAALHELVRDEPERARPGPVGRRVTEQFNDWPEGDRAAAERAAREMAASLPVGPAEAPPLAAEPERS